MSPRTYLGLHLFVGVRFQVYFTPLAGVLFTFPSRYWFTIGRKLVFSLAGWSRQIPTGFHVSRGTQEPLERELHFHLRGSHPLWPAFPDRSINAFLPSFTRSRACFQARHRILRSYN